MEKWASIGHAVQQAIIVYSQNFLPRLIFLCPMHKNQSFLPELIWMGQTILEHFDASKQHIFLCPSAPSVAVAAFIVISTSPYKMIHDYQLNLITHQNRNTTISKYLPWANKETYKAWNLIPFPNIKNHLVNHEGLQDVQHIY